MTQDLDARKNGPLVSVCVVTYNHAPYIRECLDSILKQETGFPYEICVGEDESPDGTREICQEYVEKHPDKIRLFLRNRKDVIYVNKRPTGRFNFLETIKSSHGKYIAICEGDDYWHNPDKLQKQVDFMEAHPEYSMCHTENDNLDLIQGRLFKSRWKALGRRHNEEEGIAPLLVSDQYVICTCTALARRDYTHKILRTHVEDFDHRYMMADNQLWFHLSRMGKVKYFAESMATYRRIPNSATAMNDHAKRFVFIKNVYWQRRSFAERFGYREVLPRIDQIYLNQLAMLAVITKNMGEARHYAEQLDETGLWFDNARWLPLACKKSLIARIYRLKKRIQRWKVL